MSEIFGWFPKESEEALAQLIGKYNIKSVIEVGTFMGRSAKFFANLCDEVTVIDTFVANRELRDNYPYKLDNDFYAEFEMTMKFAEVWNKIKVCKMTSSEASVLPISADLVYIDGAHDYGNVLRDLIRYEHKARVILCGDDYDEYWPGVRKAVDDFVRNRLDLHLEVFGRLWVITKKDVIEIPE